MFAKTAAQTMDEKEETVVAIHSYARRNQISEMNTQPGQFVSLPEKAEPNPAKKVNQVLTVPR